MTLRAGPLSGQDLGLLTERSVLLATKPHGEGLSVGQIVTFVGHSLSGGFSKCIVTTANTGFGFKHDRFSYIGELQPDGFISAPEGGWNENPVPGRVVESKPRKGGSVLRASEAVAWEWGWAGNWFDIIAFRLAGEAVSIPPVDAGGVVAALVGALRECQDKLWIARCNSRDNEFRAVAERAVDMAGSALNRARTEAPPVDAGEVGKAVEALTRRADAWSRNDDKCWLSVKLGDLRTVLAALSGSQGSNPKTDLPTEEPSPPVVGDDLVERLEATFPNGGDGEYADLEYVNPEGPEAAARIRELTAENERLTAELARWRPTLVSGSGAAFQGASHD